MQTERYVTEAGVAERWPGELLADCSRENAEVPQRREQVAGDLDTGLIAPGRRLAPHRELYEPCRDLVHFNGDAPRLPPSEQRPFGERGKQSVSSC